jgi:1,4-dihydroxy-2-naphthoate octaprenyltransferase
LKAAALARTWFFQIRGPFLILSVVLVLIGTAAAGYEGVRQPFHAALLFAGVILAHASVNCFNELSDDRTGVDGRTVRTPFSGGSGLLQAGMTTPRQVASAAYATLAAAAAIGLYFVFVRGTVIFVFMVLGGLAIRFYTSFLARWILGELAAGLCLGSLVVVGSYTVLTGRITPGILVVSAVPGLLTALLLFLNEFPDAEADRTGGRRHLVIVLGRRLSSRLYVAALFTVYMTIAAASFIRTVPPTVLVALLTGPIAFFAVRIVWRDHQHPERMIPALALNVAVVLLTDLLLAVGYWVAE